MFHFKTLKKSSFALLLLLLTQAGCNQVDFQGVNEEPSKAVQRFDDPNCYGLKHTQPNQPNNVELDILFVVDTSGSLQDERETIVTEINAFIAQLPSQVMNYHVGVLLGHASASQYSGKLYVSDAGEPKVIKSEGSSFSQIQSDLTKKFMNPKQHNKSGSDIGADGGETMLVSLSRMLEPGNLAAVKEAGLFRDNAALAVVFITDENDICARDPNGKPWPDTDGIEYSIFNNQCGNTTYESTLLKLKEARGTKPLITAGILYSQVYPNYFVYPKDADGRQAEDSTGYGILELLQASDGVVVDLAAGQLRNGLENIGKRVAQKLIVKTDFKLEHSPIDVSSLKASVDGSPVTLNYTPLTNEVHLTYAGGSGSVVEINYCQQLE